MRRARKRRQWSIKPCNCSTSIKRRATFACRECSWFRTHSLAAITNAVLDPFFLLPALLLLPFSFGLRLLLWLRLFCSLFGSFLGNFGLFLCCHLLPAQCSLLFCEQLGLLGRPFLRLSLLCQTGKARHLCIFSSRSSHSFSICLHNPERHGVLAMSKSNGKLQQAAELAKSSFRLSN